MASIDLGTLKIIERDLLPPTVAVRDLAQISSRERIRWLKSS